MLFNLNFFKNKRVLVTGHTGFKGSWLCEILIMAGAELTGYALEDKNGIFSVCGLTEQMNSTVGDVRDMQRMLAVFQEVEPEIVIHMAAQPLVRESYKNPVYTYETNVMGTVNVLECVRMTASVKSFVNVTTDKVYLNKEWEWGYRENEELNGYDPYSNSKSCSELVTSCYRNAFFKDREIGISTVRAGNVIGGGDFSKDRIIPDCIRAAYGRKKIVVRNPCSIRPYQHVLEPLVVYLMIAQAQYIDKAFSDNYNVGPDESDCLNTSKLVSLFCKEWNKMFDENVVWISQNDEGPHEASYLRLDCSKLKQRLEWKPCWDISRAMKKIIEWTDIYYSSGNVEKCMQEQINEFMCEMQEKGLI